MLEIFLPKRCLGCLRRINCQADLCTRCVPPLPNLTGLKCSSCFTDTIELDHDQLCCTCNTFPLLARKTAYLWEYDLKIQQLITAMKYRPSQRLNRILAKYIELNLEAIFPDPDWHSIALIPSLRSTMQQRGFHQGVELGLAVERAIRATPRSMIIHNSLSFKRGRHKPQAGLPLQQRLLKIKPYLVNTPKKTANKRLLLVDDVITTGATINAAVQTLLCANASSVDVLALARSKHWQSFRATLFNKLKNEREK